jgi:hypothetical protein
MPGGTSRSSRARARAKNSAAESAATVSIK